MTSTFIDSHVHLWDPRRMPYAWLASVPAIAGPRTPVELRHEAGAELPSQMVFVECGIQGGAEFDEVSWIETLAREEPRIAAIVAHCPMDAGPTTAAAIDNLRGRPLVRGVRHLIQDERDPEFCVRPAFVEGVRRLGAAGLTFDVCCRAPQLPAVAALCRACPGTRFVLDHLGKPAVGEARLDPWREDLRALAALPNVDCKLSGLVTEAGPDRWDEPKLRPYVDHALETFGPSRLLFGGDWPVLSLVTTYPRWLAAARRLLAPLSPVEREAVFGGNARRAYRLS